MTNDEYQEFTKTTAVYPSGEVGIDYVILGMVAEAGEVAGKWAKYKRGDYNVGIDRLSGDMDSEVGDLLWFISQYCNETDTTIEALMEINMIKLRDRQKRGVLKGNGDTR